MALKFAFLIPAALLVFQFAAGDWKYDLYKLVNYVDYVTAENIGYLQTYDTKYLQAVLTVDAFEDDAARIYYYETSESHTEPDISKLEVCLNASASEIQHFKDEGIKNITAFQNGHEVILSATILGGLKKRASFQTQWSASYYNDCIETQSPDVCNQHVALIVKFVTDLLQAELKEFVENHDFAKVAQDAENLYQNLNETRAGIIETVVDCAQKG